MNVLILTCNTGSGHNSAAAAIAAELDLRGIPHTTKNALEFVPKAEEEGIVRGFDLFYKYAPEVFGAGYRFSESHDASALYAHFALFAPALQRFLNAHDFTCIVCTHVFPALMCTRLRHRYNLPINQFFVATDYTCSPSVNLLEMDGVFIPKGLRAEFLFQGMADDVLKETGIPVKRACYESVTKEFAREELRGELVMTPDEKIVLLAPRCLEYAEITDVALPVLERVPDARFVVLCGKGYESQRRALAQLQNPRLVPLGLTKRMPLWMKAADVLITKPGGLTVSEAASSGVPMLLIDSKPGLETHNKDYLVNHGCANTSTGLAAVYTDLIRLLEDDKARAGMRAAQRKYFGTVAVAELVDELEQQDALRAARTAEAQTATTVEDDGLDDDYLGFNESDGFNLF